MIQSLDILLYDTGCGDLPVDNNEDIIQAGCSSPHRSLGVGTWLHGTEQITVLGGCKVAHKHPILAPLEKVAPIPPSCSSPECRID